MSSDPFVTNGLGSAGGLHLVLTRCEIEGKKTIHVDAFHPASEPYGHIGLKEVLALKAWIEEAIPWLAQKKAHGRPRKEELTRPSALEEM